VLRWANECFDQDPVPKNYATDGYPNLEAKLFLSIRTGSRVICQPSHATRINTL